MKILKRIVIASLFLTLLSGCNSSPHIHNWGSYFDNGDGTHSRICLKDVNHKETEKHIFKDEEIIVKPTETTPGHSKVVCSKCGYSELHELKPTGDHVFDKEVVDEKYLYEKCSDYSSIYYKSCECGAFGDPDYLFESSLLPEGYSNLEYIQGNGVQYIDVGVKNDENKSLKYNVCKQSSGGLPKDYQEVEYIESTGTQYIDLGWSTTDGMIVEYKASWSKQGHMVSSHSVSYPYGRNGIYPYLNENKWEFGYGETCLHYGAKTGANVNQIYNLYCSTLYDNAWVYVDGEKICECSGEHTSSTNIMLFCNAYQVEEKKATEGKLYYCKIWDKHDVLVFDLIPVLREDGAVGMYDFVSKKFLANNGTGNFKYEFGNNSSKTTQLSAKTTQNTNISNGYTKLEYIKTNGTQYINTGFTPDNNTGIYAEFAFSSFENFASILFSSGVDYNERAYELYPWDGKMEINYGPHCAYLEGIEYTPNDRIAYLQNKNNFKLNIGGSEFNYSFPTQEFVTPGPLTLFAWNREGRISPCAECVTLYSMQIYDGNTVVRDYVPVIRNSDGKVGLLDKLNNKFYGNNGTGEFIAGPRKTCEYTELEYIESKGAQYINTGINVGPNITSVIDWKINEITNTKNGWSELFGYTKDDSGKPYSIWGDGNKDLISFYTDAGKTNINRFNDRVTTTFVSNTEQTSGSIYVFSAGPDSPTYSEALNPYKLYALQIFDGETLVRDFVPVIRNSDGAVGLLDKVNNKFYGNDGTGEFIAGPRKTSEYTELEYIESTGSQYIDTSVLYSNTHSYKLHTNVSYSTIEPLNQIIGFTGNAGNGIGTFNDTFWECEGSVCEKDVLYNLSWERTPTTCCRVINGFVYDGQVNTTDIEGFSLKLFAACRTVTDLSLSYYCSMKMYSCQIFDDDVLVRDFVPVIRNSDGAVGLLDKVNNKFYGNDGTGEFIAGPRKDTPMEDILIGYQYGGYSPSYYYGRIYDAQIYDGDTLIRNLIPCIRNSDSQVGMYDLVNNVFYPTSSPAEFNNSGVIGHHLDEGRITKQATYKEDGTKEYTCSICGEKIIEKIPRLSYEVKFIGGEGVKEIRIYSNDKDLINYYVGDTAYSRNIFTYNYSKVNSGVYFEIVLEDGYTLEDISYDSSLCTYIEGEGYKMIYELQGDVVINVVTSKNP